MKTVLGTILIAIHILGRKMRYASEAAKLLLVVTVLTLFAANQSQAEDVARDCWKPSPPFRSDFETSESFRAAKEEYFSQATFYIACLDTWVKETEIRYQEMFKAEVAVYALERDELLSELRLFTQSLGN